MNVNQLKSSHFLKKEDCGAGVLLTVQDCQNVNVAKEGAPEEMKPCLFFSETEKPMVLNSTNGQIIAGFMGSDETHDWHGRQVVLYHDPSITYGGKLIGGIRAREPRKPKVAPAPTAPPLAPPMPRPPYIPAPPMPTAPTPVPAPMPAALPAAESDDIPF